MDKNLSVFLNQKFDTLFNLDLNNKDTSEGCSFIIIEIDSLLLALEYICTVNKSVEKLQGKLLVPSKISQKCIEDFQTYALIEELCVEENLPIIKEYFSEKKEKSKKLFLRATKDLDCDELKILLAEFNNTAINKKVELLNLQQLVKEQLEMVSKFWLLPGKETKIEYVTTILDNIVVLANLYQYFSESVSFVLIRDKVKELKEKILSWKCRLNIGLDLDDLKEEMSDLSERDMLRRMKYKNEQQIENLEWEINENIETIL